MYIDDRKGIQTMGHYVRKGGLDFATFDELADAVRRMGKMFLRDDAEIEELIIRLRTDMNDRTTTPARVSRVMGNALGNVSPGVVTVGPGEWTFGNHFATYNENICPWGPLGDHTLRIAELKSAQDDTAYRLKVIDRTLSTDINPVRIPNNHSENLLAARLGMPRPLRNMLVCAYYAPDGKKLQFDFGPLLAALGSIEGLAEITDSPEAVADRCIETLYVEDFSVDNHPLFLPHSTGNVLCVVDCRPLELYSGALKLRKQVRREGSCVVGPLAQTSLGQQYGPHITFIIKAPQFVRDMTDPQQVLSANQRLIDLADQLTTALWSYQEV